MRGGEAVKRALDVGGAAVGLSLLSPVVAGVALAVLATLGRPIFFRQERPGHEGRPFTLVKFRTMRDRTDAWGRALPDEARLTRFGRFLRRTSLDELPELWNVLKGEMSLVGPRPLLMEYLPLYTSVQARRHEVRPGITGLAQVSGRNALEWEEKFTLDVWYVEHRSMKMDAAILFKTIGKVLIGQGIAPEGRESVEPFRGSR